MLTTQEKKLLKLAKTFTKDTLGCEDSKGMCFTLSWALSLHLEINHFGNTLKVGKFNKIGHDRNGCDHVWLVPQLNKEKIIDSTIRQFYKGMPLVYFCKKPDSFIKEKDLTYKGFKNSFNKWLKSFFDQDFREENKLDLKVLLRINLKAATILYIESEKMDFDITNNTRYKKYCLGINKIVVAYKQIIDLLISELPIGFDSLRSKILNRNQKKLCRGKQQT